MANKMTKKVALEMALTFVPENETELRDKLTAMIETVSKKSDAPRKPSAKQVENDAVRVKIMDFLNSDPDKGFRISEICAGVPELADATSQRVSGLLRTLFLNGMVDKFVDKRVTYFKVMPM